MQSSARGPCLHPQCPGAVETTLPWHGGRVRPLHEPILKNRSLYHYCCASLVGPHVMAERGEARGATGSPKRRFWLPTRRRRGTSRRPKPGEAGWGGAIHRVSGTDSKYLLSRQLLPCVFLSLNNVCHLQDSFKRSEMKAWAVFARAGLQI